jgi:HEAT repeat protein
MKTIRAPGFLQVSFAATAVLILTASGIAAAKNAADPPNPAAESAKREIDWSSFPNPLSAGWKQRWWMELTVRQIVEKGWTDQPSHPDRFGSALERPFGWTRRWMKHVRGNPYAVPRLQAIWKPRSFPFDPADRALAVLIGLGIEAKPALPELIASLEGGWQSNADDSLDFSFVDEIRGRRMPPYITFTPPVDFDEVKDCDRTRQYTLIVIALGAIGPDAKEAVPQLIRIQSDEKFKRFSMLSPGLEAFSPADLDWRKGIDLRKAAANALATIAPDSSEVAKTSVLQEDKASRQEALLPTGRDNTALATWLKGLTENDASKIGITNAALSKNAIKVTPDSLPVLIEALRRQVRECESEENQSDPSKKDAGGQVQVDSFQNQRNVQANRLVFELLSDLGPQAEAAIPTLEECLKHKKLRIAALETLAWIGPPAIPTLLKNLRTASNQDPDAPTIAPEKLSARLEEVKQKVRQLPPNSDEGRRLRDEYMQLANEAMNNMERQKRGDLREGMQVAAALAAIGPDAESAVPELMTMLKSGPISSAEAAATVLAAIGPPAVDGLSEVARQGTAPRSTWAAKALSDIGWPAVKPLAQLLSDATQPGEIRCLAAKGLANAGKAAEPALPILVDAFANKDEQLKMDTAIALGNLGEAAAPAVSALIAELQRLHGDLSPMPKEPAKYQKAVMKYQEAILVARALGAIGPQAKEALPILIKYMESGEPEFALAVHRIGPDAASIPSLLKLLAPLATRSGQPSAQNRKFGPRAEAAEFALATVRSDVKEILPLLLKELENENTLVRAHAAILVGRVGPAADKAVPLLRGALKEDDDLLVASAAFALGRIGTAAKPAIHDLQEALDRQQRRPIKKAIQKALVALQ